MTRADNGALDRDAPNFAPPPGHPRFPLVDSLRAIAALSIVGLHVQGSIAQNTWVDGFWENLAWGVQIFFVISGFLLYRPFVAARFGQARRMRVREFYGNRVLRIVPAYWLALTVLAATAGLSGVFTDDWWRFYGLLQSYDSDTTYDGIVVAWSLSLEAGLYLVLPLYAGLVAWLHARRRDDDTALRLEWIALGSLLLGAAIVHDVIAESTQATALVLVLEAVTWFGFGMALALLSVGAAHRGEAPAPVRWLRRRPEVAWTTAGAIFLAAGAGLFSAEQEWAYYLLIGLTGLLVVFPAVFVGETRGPVRRVLEDPRLAWLGLISYGIYLWHNALLFELRGEGGYAGPVEGVLGTLLALALTLAAATLSYYALERPALRLKRHLRSQPGRARAAADGRADEEGERPGQLSRVPAG